MLMQERRPSTAKLSDDPIRLYLNQMSRFRCLRAKKKSRCQEIEITRKRFRRAVLSNDYALRTTVEI